MPRFAFLIEIENVIVNWEGRQRAVGCMVTRVARAANVSTAMSMAISRTGAELKAEGDMLNPPDNPPRYRVDKHRTLRWLEKSPETGFLWHDESDET